MFEGPLGMTSTTCISSLLYPICTAPVTLRSHASRRLCAQAPGTPRTTPAYTSSFCAQAVLLCMRSKILQAPLRSFVE